MSVNATAARCSRRMWLASSKPPVARHYGQEGDRRSENVGAPALISIHGSPPGEECRASLTIPLVPQARPLTRRHSDLTSPTAWDSASPSAGRSPKRVAASCDTSRIPEAARSFASPPRGSGQWPLKVSSTPVDYCICSLAARAPPQVRIGSIPDPHPFAPDCKKCGHDHRAEEKADQSERC
jgi:hypothetical protein